MNMVSYQFLINQIRMCRFDLEELTITKGVQELPKASNESVQDWLEFCILMAKAGKPMPWEKGIYVSIKDNKWIDIRVDELQKRGWSYALHYGLASENYIDEEFAYISYVDNRLAERLYKLIARLHFRKTMDEARKHLNKALKKENKYESLRLL